MNIIDEENIWSGKKLFSHKVSVSDYSAKINSLCLYLSYIGFIFSFSFAILFYFFNIYKQGFWYNLLCFFPAISCLLGIYLYSKNKLHIGFLFGYISGPIGIAIAVIDKAVPNFMIYTLVYGLTCFFLLPKAIYVYVSYCIASICFILVDIDYIARQKSALDYSITFALIIDISFAVLMYFVFANLRNILNDINLQKKINSQQLVEQNMALSAYKSEIDIQNMLLQQRNLQLINSCHFQQRITSVLSHDVRTSLIFLKHILSAYKKEYKSSFILLKQLQVTPNKEMNEADIELPFISELETELNKINCVFEEILLWLKDPQMFYEVKKDYINISDLSEEIIYTYRGQAKAKNIEIVNRLEPSQRVYANADFLKIILRNLLSNAIKYSFYGKQIFLSGKVVNEYYELLLEDQGVGISTDNLKKITEGLGISTQGTGKENGTGLGLFFCREFLKKINGMLEISSLENKGTKIIIYLPI